MGNPNEIYDDRVHKFSFNVPLSLWDGIQHKTRQGTRYNGIISVYILELIDRDLREYGTVIDRPISAESVSHRASEGQVFYPDPPRKYHGFLGGLKRNSYVNQWVSRRREIQKTFLK